MGAWIEMTMPPYLAEHYAESHPTWVRGLKLKPLNQIVLLIRVAPHVGAWIEIL